MEEEGYAGCTEDNAENVVYNAGDDGFCSHGSHQHHHEIQGESEDDSGEEGEQVGQLPLANHQHQNHQQHCLKGVAGHAEGEEGKVFRNLQVQDVGRSGDHGHAEVSQLHQGSTERQDNDAQNIG